MPEKETLTIALSLKVAGFFLMLFTMLATFWWRFSSKFVNKETYILQTKTFTENLKRHEKESAVQWKAHEKDSERQWGAITEARDASVKACVSSEAAKDLLQEMKDNRQKRKGD